MTTRSKLSGSSGTVKVVDPKDALCPGDSCLYKANGHSLYFDAGHLSPEGARYVESTLEPCFEGQGR